MVKTTLGTLALLAITCTMQPVGQALVPASPHPAGSPGGGGSGLGVTISAGPATAISPPPTVGVQATTANSGAPPLLAAIEATETTSGPHFNAVALAGSDGRAPAKTSFAALSAPTLPGGDVVILPNAQMAAGGVYFMDGRGVVRKLARNGSESLVATFPLSGEQQEASFAVSPDGTQLAASVLTLPRDGQGSYKLDVETATPGQAATIIRHAESEGAPAADDTPPPAGSPPSSFPNLQLVGWDNQGAIALVGSQLVVNNDPYLAGHRFFGGHLARLGPDGIPGPTLGGEGCHPYSLEAGAIVVCARALGPSQAIGVSLRTSSGRVLWSVDAGQGCFAPSPDHTRLAMKGAVRGQDGSSVALSGSFCPLGWFDDKTLVGTAADVHWFAPYPLALVHLASPAQTLDLGFSAWYAGTL